MKVFGKEIGKAIKFPPFIDQFVGKLLPNHRNEEMVIVPSVNISDEDKAFELSIALPGMGKEDVQIEVQDNYLTIRAQSHADPEKVEAKMKNGRLDIKVGKKDNLKAQKTITVN